MTAPKRLAYSEQLGKEKLGQVTSRTSCSWALLAQPWSWAAFLPFLSKLLSPR